MNDSSPHPLGLQQRTNQRFSPTASPDWYGRRAMDPLSMAASIVAVLQLTSSLVDYINETRNATAEQKKVAIEASNLYSLLTLYAIESKKAGRRTLGSIR